MKYNLTKKQEWLLLITIFLSNVIVMDDSIFTPTVNALFVMFPEGTSLINFAITGCYIFIVVFSIIVGKLCSKYDKKSLLILGGILGAIGGLGMIFIVTPLSIAICRGLLMISYAFTMTVGLALITDLYTDEARRGKMIGYYNGIMQGIGAVLAFVAGILATKSLQLAYSTHILIVLYLIMLFMFVPSFKPVNEMDSNEATNTSKEGLGMKYWLLVSNASVYFCAFCMILFFISVYVAENNLGNEAMAGTMSTVITIAGFITPMLYGQISALLGKHTSIISFISTLIGCVIFYLMPNLVGAFAGVILMGAANPLVRTWAYDKIPSIVPESRIDDAIGYFTSISTALSCVTAYLVTWGMTLLGCETFTSFLIVPIVIFAITTLIDLYLGKISN